MAKVKGPLVYAEWIGLPLDVTENEPQHDGAEHALILQVDFYCYANYTCVIVDERGNRISGNKVRIDPVPPNERLIKDANAQAKVYYIITKETNNADHWKTIKLEEIVNGKWENYMVDGTPGLEEVRVDLHHYIGHKLGQIYSELTPHDFDEEKESHAYIKLSELEEEVKRHSCDTEVYEQFRELYKDLTVYTFEKEKYLRLSDTDEPMSHLRGHTTVIVGGG